MRAAPSRLVHSPPPARWGAEQGLGATVGRLPIGWCIHPPCCWAKRKEVNARQGNLRGVPEERERGGGGGEMERNFSRVYM